MRLVIAALLAIQMPTACIGQSDKRLVLTLSEGNRVLDSLKSRADWERSYRVLYSQYLLAKDHANDLDSTSVTANAHCDSVVRQGFARERELITDNTALTREVNEAKQKGKNANVERWCWRIVGALVLILGATSK